MTTHDSRPAGAAPRPRAGPRGGRTSASTNPRVAVRTVLVAAAVGALLGLGPAPASAQPELRPTIALTSSRDGPGTTFEVYLINPDPDPQKQVPRRLTYTGGNAFPVMSPDGKQIVFDSNRNRAAGEPVNTSDLFLMKSDGTVQRLLTRGSSASWSPDGKRIAFHASASGTGLPVNAVPGVQTRDSDLFVAKVGDLLDLGTGRTNRTNSPGHLDYDADWSPDGTQIAFVRHPNHNDPVDPGYRQGHPPDAEIYVIKADGTGGPTQLTYNRTADAAPDWSPDGKRIAFMCTTDSPPLPPASPIEICVMNADGSNRRQLTDNGMFEGTPVWSPDGKKILFSRQLGQGAGGAGQELFVIDQDAPGIPLATQLTDTPGPGVNFSASWGLLRVTAP